MCDSQARVNTDTGSISIYIYAIHSGIRFRNKNNIKFVNSFLHSLIVSYELRFDLTSFHLTLQMPGIECERHTIL